MILQENKKISHRLGEIFLKKYMAGKVQLSKYSVIFLGKIKNKSVLILSRSQMVPQIGH